LVRVLRPHHETVALEHRAHDVADVAIVEAIVALPDQLFYNTGISTYIWVLTNRKERQRKGKIQLIDARRFFVKRPPRIPRWDRG